MVSVIRRIGIAVIFVLTLSACAGAERASLTVGDISVNRADLIELTDAALGNPDPDSTATVDAAALRNITGIALQDAAVATALAEQGITFTEQDRVTTEAQVSEGIAAQQLPAVFQGSGAWEILVRSIWLGSLPAEQFDDSVFVRIEELMRGAELESRIGEVNQDAFGPDALAETPLIVAR